MPVSSIVTRTSPSSGAIIRSPGPRALRRLEQHAHAGGVHEREAAQVEHDVVARIRERVLEPRGGRQIQLPAERDAAGAPVVARHGEVEVEVSHSRADCMATR